MIRKEEEQLFDDDIFNSNSDNYDDLLKQAYDINLKKKKH